MFAKNGFVVCRPHTPSSLNKSPDAHWTTLICSPFTDYPSGIVWSQHPMPKGGGRKAFLKGVRHDSDSDAEPSEQNKAQPKQPVAKPNLADAFKHDATQAPPPAPADSGEADGEAAGTETRGQMLQRHKRVRVSNKRVPVYRHVGVQYLQEIKALKEKYKKLGKKHKDEAVKEEAALEASHAAQLDALTNRDAQRDAVQQVSDGLCGVALGEGAREKKLTKAQRQREKRAQRDAEREARIETERAAMPESERRAEERALRNVLKPLGLVVHEIKVC